MLIRYTAALFNNAVFSKSVWASGECLCLIRLGRGSIVDVEDSVVKTGIQWWRPTVLKDLSILHLKVLLKRGMISHKHRHNYFFEKQPVRPWVIKCQVLLCWMMVVTIWDRHWHKLKLHGDIEKVKSSEIQLLYRHVVTFSPSSVPTWPFTVCLSICKLIYSSITGQIPNCKC